MARLKLGAFITEISGSLGGQSIQKNRSGISLKTKVNNVDQATPAQLEQRSIMLAVQNAWRSLSDDQRKAWHFSIDFFKAISLKDSSVQLSGRELFIRWNILLLTAGLSIVTTPDFNSSYEIDSDFSLYADDLSFFAVFDSDPAAADKTFLLNMSRSAPSYYSPARSSAKRIESIDMGAGGFDLKESFISQHAVLPQVSENVSGIMRQFSKVVPISSAPKRFVKSVLPVSDLNPGINWVNVGSISPYTSLFIGIKLSDNSIIFGTSPPASFLKSLDNGKNFSITYNSSVNAQIVDIVENSPGVLSACTSSLGILFYSSDFGLNWQNLGKLFSINNYRSYVRTHDHGLYLFGGQPACFIKSLDNGLTWLPPVFLPSESLCSATIILKSGRILSGTAPSGKIFYSDDFGSTWIDNGRLFSSTQITSLFQTSSGRILAVNASDPNLYYSDDEGITFFNLGPLAVSGFFSSFLEINHSYIIAGLRKTGRIAISIDDGLTWSISPNLFSVSNIFNPFSLGNGSLMAGSSSSGLILRSSIFPNA